jgi:hypothetical protein
MKMKSRIALTILLLLSLGTEAGIGEEQKHNGYWWANHSENFKTGFVVGYVIGMNNARDMLVGDCVAMQHGGVLPAEAPTEEEIKPCAEMPVLTNLKYNTVLPGQLADGTDEFYKDFKNKDISITLALRYVRDELTGTPAEELEKELARFRQVHVVW